MDECRRERNVALADGCRWTSVSPDFSRAFHMTGNTQTHFNSWPKPEQVRGGVGSVSLLISTRTGSRSVLSDSNRSAVGSLTFRRSCEKPWNLGALRGDDQLLMCCQNLTRRVLLWCLGRYARVIYCFSL